MNNAMDNCLFVGLRLGLVVLLGLALPARAQQIMSFEEYQSIHHSEPYTYHLETDEGALFYFGSRHSFDPADPQLDELKEAWDAFRPEVAYTEGGELTIDSLALAQVIERYGEFGMTWHLARQDSVPARSLDPSRAAEVAYLKEQLWRDEQIMLFYTLRQVAQSQNQQVSVDLKDVVPQYLNSLTQRFNLRGPTTLPEFEDTVRRLLPAVQNWQTISMSYFYPGPQDPTFFTNEIATDSNRFRDLYHVELLVEAVLSGKDALIECRVIDLKPPVAARILLRRHEPQ